MRHFITFQKKKALCLTSGEGVHEHLAHALNHELMKYGFILSKPCFDVLVTLTEDELAYIHKDLTDGLRRVVGDSEGYEPLYLGFPQSVLALSYKEFLLNAVTHYWSEGTWRPSDAAYLEREFAVEAVKYTPITLLTEEGLQSIFDDLLYGGISLSSFDKECLDWYLDGGGTFEFSRIRFHETAAWLGKRMLDDVGVTRLPTRKSIKVLRIWAAYSGGDEGLKEPTRFRSPSVRQRRVLLATLDGCVDLEDSFKSRRSVWLRLLHYLHPGTQENRELYPTVAGFADRLRNRPKTLRTYNSRVTALMEARDPAIFELLKRRPGTFMRRMDHLVREFGVDAIHRWLELDVSFGQLVTLFNHFSGRAEEKAGRSAVLAGQGSSEVVTFDAQEPLDIALVEHITELLMARLRQQAVLELKDASVWIHPSLYQTPLATNNRASSLALSGRPVGTRVVYEEGKTLRCYVHWHGRHDVDLSAFVLTTRNEIIKVGWNGTHVSGDYLVYSGDNTGFGDKNAEYMDINTPNVPSHVDWVIVEARIFRGPSTFAGFDGKVHAGWMSREHPEKGKRWLPKTLSHAVALKSESRTSYLMAYHPASRSIIHLDLSMGQDMVSSPADALKMRVFLNDTIDLNTTSNVSWEKLQQGHVLELLAGRVVKDENEADVRFDVNTTAEQISRLMMTATTQA